MQRVMMFAVVLLLAGGAWGDVVHLKDGSKREGRVVEQTDDVVVLEMRAGGATARVTLRTEDVDRIEKKKTEHEKVEEEYRRRLRELDRNDADAVIALAEWCHRSARYEEATTLLTALAKAGGEKFRRGVLALATMDCDRGRFKTAKTHLATLLAKHPGDAGALALAKRIDAAEVQMLEKLLAGARASYDAGEFDKALRSAESFQQRATPAQAQEAIGRSPLVGMKGFEDFVAEARLHRACTACKDGLKLCPACKGKTDPEKGLCPSCGGVGGVVCDRCGGTAAKFADVPDWEVAAVGRALEKRATDDAAALAAIAKMLAGNPKEDQLIPAVSKAGVLASRALRWLDELEKLAKKHPGVTKRVPAADRAGVTAQFREICVRLGDHYRTGAETAWRAIRTGTEGMLAKDKELRQARDDLRRARYFYGRTRPKAKAPYPVTVAVNATAAERTLAEVERKVDHNDKMLRAYRIVKTAYNRDRTDIALKALVAAVENGSKPDLQWLSTESQKDLNHPLDEVMAICRFEVGKEDGKFGTTTEYERSAFIKKLLREADATASLAHADYQRMLGFLDHGRRNDVPTSMVRRTRENAEDARRWYRAVFGVPYPISSRKRKEIDDQIEYMSKIARRCRRWYHTGLPVPGP